MSWYKGIKKYNLQDYGCFESSSVFELTHMLPKQVELGTTTRMLIVAILLPSGITLSQFSVRIGEYGCKLNVVVTWLKFLVHLKHLYQKWLLSKGSDRM